MNSCKYDGSISFFVPLAFFEGYFAHIQKFSTVFVFAKVTGFKVKCRYPFAPIWLYAPHTSETIVVPGMTNSCMIGMKVLASRRAINPSLVVVSIPPKTHCSLTSLTHHNNLFSIVRGLYWPLTIRSPWANENYVAVQTYGFHGKNEKWSQVANTPTLMS